MFYCGYDKLSMSESQKYSSLLAMLAVSRLTDAGQPGESFCIRVMGVMVQLYFHGHSIHLGL